MSGLLVGYAEQFGHEYYWGWRDGYWSWVFSGQKITAFNDDEGHPPNYWKGVDAGTKYGQEHVMVKIVQGHVLTDYEAARQILDWFDGQTAQVRGDPLNKLMSTAYIDGYNAPYGTLPPGIH